MIKELQRQNNKLQRKVDKLTAMLQEIQANHNELQEEHDETVKELNDLYKDFETLENQQVNDLLEEWANEDEDKEDKEDAVNQPVPSDVEEEWQFKFINGKALDVDLEDDDDVFNVKAFIADKYDAIFKETGQSIKDINLIYKGERLISSQKFSDLEPAIVTIHIKGDFKGGGKRAKATDKAMEEDDPQSVLDATLDAEEDDPQFIKDIITAYGKMWTAHEFKAAAEEPSVTLKDLNEWQRILMIPGVANSTAGRKVFLQMPLIKDANKLNERLLQVLKNCRIYFAQSCVNISKQELGHIIGEAKGSKKRGV